MGTAASISAADAMGNRRDDPSAIEDRELWADFCYGDSKESEDAACKLVRKYQELVFWRLRSVYKHEDREELAQEVFMRLFRLGSKFQPSGRIAALLLRITQTVYIDRHRRENAQKTPPTVTLEKEPRTWDDSPEALAIDSSYRDWIFRHSGILTRSENRIVRLELDGLSNLEIAATLATSPNAVRVHRANATRKLRQVWRGEEG